jgi:hypothetical protein
MPDREQIILLPGLHVLDDPHSLQSTGAASYVEGLDTLLEIRERRSARGYLRAG